MSMFKLLTEGSWWIRSKSDPRWNADGSGEVGGFIVPPDAQAVIDRFKRELGCDPPGDLEYGYMKY